MMTKTRHRSFLILALFGLAGHACAAQAAPVHVDQVTRLRFPPALGTMQFEEVRQYGSPDLGYCVVYRGKDALGQMCVYDLGHRDLPTGVDSDAFKAALGFAVEATLRGIRSPPFRGGELFAEGSPSIELEGKAAKAEMRILTSKMDGPNATTVANTHLILMTTGLGKFLKLNYTAQNMNSEQFSGATRDVIVDFIGYNEPLMVQLLVPKY